MADDATLLGDHVMLTCLGGQDSGRHTCRSCKPWAGVRVRAGARTWHPVISDEPLTRS